MRSIPRNLLTLYADLVQSTLAVQGKRPATISRRLEGAKRRLYAIIRDGTVKQQLYLGTVGDPDAEAKAKAYLRSAEEAKHRRKSVSVLKRSGIFAPDPAFGRVLEVLANAGLFECGMVLVGTAAYQLYPCVLGAHLPAAGLQTQDAGLAFARLALPHLSALGPLDAVLKRADPTFEARFSQDDTLPTKFVATNGLMIEILTEMGRTKPMLVKGLGCEAVPLRFMEYLIEDAIDVVALVGSGVVVRVPDPARYAVHKLIIAQERPLTSQKSGKDVDQAREIFSIMRMSEPDRIEDALDAARERGPAWRKRVAQGLSRL